MHDEIRILFHFAIILYGDDFNARVGATIADILGAALSLTDRNENGLELLVFCQKINWLL